MISQYFGIKPDIVTLAKGFSKWYSNRCYDDKFERYFTFGDHGSTFGGNHLSTTVCKSVLKILEKYSNSGKLGENIKYFNSCLQYFTDKYPNIFCKKMVGDLCKVLF